MTKEFLNNIIQGPGIQNIQRITSKVLGSIISEYFKKNMFYRKKTINHGFLKDNWQGFDESYFFNNIIQGPGNQNIF